MNLTTMVHTFLIDGHGSSCVLKVPCIKRYIPCYHTRENGEKLMRRQTQEGKRMLDTSFKYSENNAVRAYCMTHLAMKAAKKLLCASEYFCIPITMCSSSQSQGPRETSD